MLPISARLPQYQVKQPEKPSAADAKPFPKLITPPVASAGQLPVKFPTHGAYSAQIGVMRYLKVTKSCTPIDSNNEDLSEILASLALDAVARRLKSDSSELDREKLWGRIRDQQFKNYLKETMDQWFSSSPYFLELNPSKNAFYQPNETQLIGFFATEEGRRALDILSRSGPVNDYFSTISTGNFGLSPSILNR